jgi:signal transduction histidine kinase
MRRAMAAPSTWFGVSILAALVICGAGILPVGKATFGLDARKAALCFLPTIVPGLLLGILDRREKVSARTFATWSAIGAAFFQFFMWSLVSLSSGAGAPMMATFPLLLSAYHGHMFASSPRHPYIALGTVAGNLMATGLNHDARHLAIYWVSLPVAVGLSLVLGHIAEQGNRSRLERIALREAVDAQILKERVQEQEALSEALLKLRGTHHDAGNALSGALFNLEQLSVEARRTPLDEQRCQRVGEMAADLVISLERLRKLLQDARNTANSGDAYLEAADIPKSIEEAAGEARARFPRISIEINATALERYVMIPGGSVTLQRIMANLVTNACEGDGARGASRILLRYSDGVLGKLLIEVVDDGPGFSAQRLNSPFVAFKTTKAGGSGLGLYTAKRLVEASAGTLTIRNGESGFGAVVEVALPRRGPR